MQNELQHRQQMCLPQQLRGRPSRSVAEDGYVIVVLLLHTTTTTTESLLLLLLTMACRLQGSDAGLTDSYTQYVLLPVQQ